MLNVLYLRLDSLVIVRVVMPRLNRRGFDMFRMKACYMITPTKIEVRIKSANFTKYMTIGKLQRGNTNLQGYHDAFDYQLFKRMKELIRDELFKKYGNTYRMIEFNNRNYIDKSFASCAKRIKQVSIFN